MVACVIINLSDNYVMETVKTLKRGGSLSLKFARNKSPRQVDSFLDGRIPFILTALLENQFTRFFSKKY